MTIPVETAIVGWDAIAEIFGRLSNGRLVISTRRLRRMRDELIGAGVIFQVGVGKRRKRMWACFPSDLRSFIRAKAANREII